MAMIRYQQIGISLLLIFIISCTTKSKTDSKFEKASYMKMNRLADEQSPYLLQHADNPVDWFAWSDEAFEKAEKENKPIHSQANIIKKES